MPVLNTAATPRIGTIAVVRIYHGSARIWGPPAPEPDLDPEVGFGITPFGTAPFGGLAGFGVAPFGTTRFGLGGTSGTGNFGRGPLGISPLGE